MKYRLMKLVGGQWYEWGDYNTLNKAIKAAFYLGRNTSYVEDVMVIDIDNIDKYDLYRDLALEQREQM